MSSKPFKEPPKLAGGIPFAGHIVGFGKNPHAFMMSLRQRFGDVAEFNLFHQKMVLLTGSEASEAFYRAPDEVLDQGPAYRLMTPIFGQGVVFDAPIKKKNQQLQMLMPALRDKPMRSYCDIIVGEVESSIAAWGDGGAIDLLEYTKLLTLYTSSHCLLGSEFRYELNAEFAEIYRDLEQGIQPIAYVFPYLPLPVFRRRDKARTRLQELVTQIMEKRAGQKEQSTNVFQMLIDAHYEDGSKLTPHEITGMLIATIFAGHHTSSGTTAWVLIELLRHPEHLKTVLAELDEQLGAEGRVSFETLRQLPKLENVIKEVLRLHPPLIILMRKVMQDFYVKEFLIKAGKFVCAAPSVTHRSPELFRSPDAFDPDRYTPERAEDRDLFGWQAFGGGRHKCSGNAFALFQIKAILCILLRRYEFELVDDPDRYQDDYQKMVVEPGSPCPIRYRLRQAPKTCVHQPGFDGKPKDQAGQSFRVRVDRDLCKGHANCMTEAPEIFQVDDKGQLTLLDENPPASLLDKAKAAEKYCPNRAIRIVSEG
ncbi:MAG: cytochrome P450 [Methylococcaceae bacterium]|nr:cytochrome P450 [Methylococcaceae bacterium]